MPGLTEAKTVGNDLVNREPGPGPREFYFRICSKSTNFEDGSCLNRVLLALHKRGTSPTVREGSQREAPNGALPYGRANAPDASNSQFRHCPRMLPGKRRVIRHQE